MLYVTSWATSQRHAHLFSGERFLIHGKETFYKLHQEYNSRRCMDRWEATQQGRDSRLEAHIEEVLALEGQGVEGWQRAHDLLDQHIGAPGQLVERLGGVRVTCSCKES